MTNSVPTQLRSVLTFDGQDDYIDFGKNDIGGVFAQGSSAFTISGWVNPHQLTNKASTYGAHNVFFARSSDRYSDNFEFGISESGNLDVYIDEKIDNVIKTFGSGELTVGEWHFFAIVFNAGQLTISLDEHEYTGSLTGSFLNNATSSVTLGATLHNYIYFTGQLANISVWNYPCTGAEIQKHCHGALVGNELGLVAYWMLNEGLGATIRDCTANAHGGTLHGSPTWDLAQLPFGIAQSSNFDLSTDITTVLAPDERQAKRRKGTTKDILESADTIQTGISSLTEAEETKTAQTGQSEVIVNIQPPEQAQTFAQEESEKTMNTEANPKYKILAIDGGGIRGIIPAMILAEIEKRTLKPISSLFDLIAGTSTGGILALGLTKPGLIDALDGSLLPEYSAENLLQIYIEYGAEIFYEPFFEKILGQLEDIFIQPKYSSEGREEIIRQYFGYAPLDKNLKEVFVTSYDIEQ
ncbi:MAG: patatin-like phospholipase family protein, partial [Rhizonema sp. PD38]|nr:patatin-like phospholipase family protein [Rhizonema sp. PD38]